MKIAPNLIGRFGNQMFIYAYARAVAEQCGHELRTVPWIGQRIFQIDDPPADGSEEPVGGYRQSQADLIYSRADCLRWFKLKPEVEDFLGKKLGGYRIEAHHRDGDYIASGYPVVSKQSYIRACEIHGLPKEELNFVTEEAPWCYTRFNDWAPFLPDFYRLMTAYVILRGNSSFSWWAATLGNGCVYAPVIDGLEGGREHNDVKFVHGNHPRLANHAFTTDLRLREI